MSDAQQSPRPRHASDVQPRPRPITPRARTDPHLYVPVVSPMPIYRLSPALDEFSLRRTPSRGGTASPAPAKGVRKRLHQYRSFDHAADLLKQSRNIVVLTGAGISTSVGIPDFRSDKGLYSQLSKDLGITEAEEFFSKDFFIHNTDQFFQHVKKVIPEAILGSDAIFRSVNTTGNQKGSETFVPKFSLTHAFLALLHSKHKLLTNYTQNIDGLEIAAGVPRTKLVQCHGSWDSASCMTCGKPSAAKKYLPVVFAGNIPYCKCRLEAQKKSKKDSKRRNSKKRSWDDFDSDHSSDDGTKAPRGLLKPDITFFNERLSDTFGDRLDDDKWKIDLLIIIGTSLKVGPVQDMLYQISPKVPQIFVSRERFSGALCNLPGVQVDVELLGECDIIIEELCRRAGWSKELKSLCWKDKQLRIKDVSVSASKLQFSQTLLDQETGTDSSNETEMTIRPHKRVRRQNSRTSQEETQSGDVKDGYNSLSKARQTIEPTIEELQLPLPPANSQSSVYDSSPRAQSKQDIGHVEKTRNLETNLVNMVSAEDVQNHVKIELVEGTTHQWRVTQK